MVTVNWIINLWIINLHKILVTPIVLALMWHFHNWSAAAFLYFGLHGTYTLLWLIKQSLFSDKRFAQPIPFWAAARQGWCSPAGSSTSCGTCGERQVHFAVSRVRRLQRS
jgi:hypothetical protein